MARGARIHNPGTVYRVMLRANGGHDIFFDEPDRIRFYDLLEEEVKRSIVCANVRKRIAVTNTKMSSLTPFTVHVHILQNVNAIAAFISNLSSVTVNRDGYVGRP